MSSQTHSYSNGIGPYIGLSLYRTVIEKYSAWTGCFKAA